MLPLFSSHVKLFAPYCKTVWREGWHRTEKMLQSIVKVRVSKQHNGLETEVVCLWQHNRHHNAVVLYVSYNVRYSVYIKPFELFQKIRFLRIPVRVGSNLGWFSKHYSERFDGLILWQRYISVEIYLWNAIMNNLHCINYASVSV